MTNLFQSAILRSQVVMSIGGINMARKSPTKSPFPKKRPAAKGVFSGDPPVKRSSKVKAVQKAAFANESYNRDRKAKNE